MALGLVARRFGVGLVAQASLLLRLGTEVGVGRMLREVVDQLFVARCREVALGVQVAIGDQLLLGIGMQTAEALFAQVADLGKRRFQVGLVLMDRRGRELARCALTTGGRGLLAGLAPGPVYP